MDCWALFQKCTKIHTNVTTTTHEFRIDVWNPKGETERMTPNHPQMFDFDRVVSNVTYQCDGMKNKKSISLDGDAKTWYIGLRAKWTWGCSNPCDEGTRNYGGSYSGQLTLEKLMDSPSQG